MPNAPQWWKEGGVPAPTKSKKSSYAVKFKANKVASSAINWNVFPDIHPYDPQPAPEPVEKSPAQVLYEMRAAKGNMLGLTTGWTSSTPMPWASIPDVSKHSWEIHAVSDKGHWEKWCYENDQPIPYIVWRNMQGLPPEPTPIWASLQQTSTPVAHVPKKIRCLNRPGETRDI